ncbi:hypothetical protein LZ32DRAFT_665360 [Colletotrichum eremochloae]|nr:hypothetical protein LZ32DRAFT_665360 [Colletotrichum eremochloae]
MSLDSFIAPVSHEGPSVFTGNQFDSLSSYTNTNNLGMKSRHSTAVQFANVITNEKHLQPGRPFHFFQGSSSRLFMAPHHPQQPLLCPTLDGILPGPHLGFTFRFSSVAFASHKPANVRFTVQRLVDPSPADDNLLEQKKLREKLEGLASACGGGLGRKETSAGGAISALPRQTCYTGFDLESDENKNGKAAISMKVYLFPQFRALATGRELVDITRPL